MSEAQLAALQVRVRADADLRDRLWAARCLDDAAALAQAAGFDVHKVDFLAYMRRALAEGRLRYVPYNDDVLGLSDQELAPLFPDQPQIREQFMALSDRFRDDPALRVQLREAVDLDATTQVSRNAGFDLNRQDWLRYLVAQLRLGRLRLVPWD